MAGNAIMKRKIANYGGGYLWGQHGDKLTNRNCVEIWVALYGILKSRHVREIFPRVVPWMRGVAPLPGLGVCNFNLRDLEDDIIFSVVFVKVWHLRICMIKCVYVSFLSGITILISRVRKNEEK